MHRRSTSRLSGRGAPALLGLALFAQGACAGNPHCTLDGVAVDPASPASTRGLTGLLQCRDGIGGPLASSARYVDGQQLGLSTRYQADGGLRRAAFRAETGGERAMAEFTAQGQLSQLRCADEPLLAPAVDDARLCGFVDGKPAEVDLFDEEGRRRSRLVWRAGKLQRAESYYDNGGIATQEAWIGNRRIVREYASEDGARRSETVYLLEHGRSLRISLRQYGPGDLLLREQTWTTAGTALRDDLYHSSRGGLQSSTRYAGQGQARRADVAEYFENGRLAYQGRYRAPPQGPMTPVGSHRRFDTSGVPTVESVYADDGRWMRERAWNEAGELVRDQFIAEGGPAPGALGASR